MPVQSDGRKSPIYRDYNAKFVVKNIITNSNKTIRIFDYPIPIGTTRNLLAIEEINESDIRSSLLKGEIRVKILAGEIEVVESDIDLLQFNLSQKTFLQNAGIVNGLEVSIDQMAHRKREDIVLNGAVDDINVIFTLPNNEHFIYDADYVIMVFLNGVRQSINSDYMIAESVIGQGYDTVIMNNAPQTTPTPADIITADYYLA